MSKQWEVNHLTPPFREMFNADCDLVNPKGDSVAYGSKSELQALADTLNKYEAFNAKGDWELVKSEASKCKLTNGEREIFFSSTADANFVLDVLNKYAEMEKKLQLERDGFRELVKDQDSLINQLHAATAEIERLKAGQWISVEERLPEDFDEQGHTQPYLVFIDNPYFKNGNYHIAYFEKSSFGNQFNHWCGIEPNVHHGTIQPNVTHWMPLPSLPSPVVPETTGFNHKYDWEWAYESIGLPSNMYFGKGSEPDEGEYILQFANVRWCIFKVNLTYYVIKQELDQKNGWLEVWTKQLNQDLHEAFKYAEADVVPETTERHVCEYSRAMSQSYPRKCTKCGIKEREDKK
jgi:hypothetical protein